MALSIDEIGFGGLKLKQDDEAYRYGVDAVLLADFTRCGPSDRVMDLGTDTGVVPLILLAKYGPESVVGLEIRPEVTVNIRADWALRIISETGRRQMRDRRICFIKAGLCCYKINQMF